MSNLESILKKIGIYVSVCLFIILMFNRYEYANSGPDRILVRVDRFTGAMQVISREGWKDYPEKKAPVDLFQSFKNVP